MLESTLSKRIADYIQARVSARLEKSDKELEKKRKETGNNSDPAVDTTLSLMQERADVEARFHPATWLTDAAARAKQISMVTHALKFTHSDAKGSSVYAPKSEASSPFDAIYLTTSALFEPSVDVVGNAAALDVASLLQLDDEGETLISRIAKDDASALAPFADSHEQLAEWMRGFKEALADKELSSHKLAKQLYFPVGENHYHLISPLYASSLSQAIYERVTSTRFGEAAKVARKAKKDGKYHPEETVDYPLAAMQSFGGTKPQNISQLNSSRGGKTILLSCRPPVWQTRVTPPGNHKDAFWREYDRRAWTTARALKKFLEGHAEDDSTKAIREKRAEYVDKLVEILLQYAAEVQSLKQYAGWSADSELPLAEQLWLDPYRSDVEFQQLREKKDWQAKIADQFASWLNHKLKSDKLVMKDVEYREWSTLLERKLALLKEDLEVQTS